MKILRHLIYGVFYFMEIWKDVPGYEGKYQVSNLGNVNSYVVSPIGRILKPSINGSGYKQVLLQINKRIKSISIHSLVAMAFLDHVPCGNYVHVDHIDGDRLNNRLDNLRVVTNRQNTAKCLKRKSKYIGVTYSKKHNKWIARLRNNDIRKYLGTFNCETRAHIKYQLALQEIGETV